MSPIEFINLKVVILDTDYYALQGLNSYLAWDRRTRVRHLAETSASLFEYLRRQPEAERPDVLVVDTAHYAGPESLKSGLAEMAGYLSLRGFIVCLAQVSHPAMVEAAAEAGARAYFLKGDVRMQIAWGIVYALEQDFLVSRTVYDATRDVFHSRVFHAAILPGERRFPNMTDRVRQAIRLCVIEGMPAYLAADEMGISLHTIRGYIKEGYRILEIGDDTQYPSDMTPQERAFMRFTALSDA
jgi:DNA-binding NarL/FixJ family response regulator